MSSIKRRGNTCGRFVEGSRGILRPEAPNALPCTTTMLATSEHPDAALLSSAVLSPRAIKLNFVRMATLFAINHGAVTAVLNLCVVVLGSTGSYMNGALYVAYAATALCGSGAIVDALGYRTALIAGTGIYCM